VSDTDVDLEQIAHIHRFEVLRFTMDDDEEELLFRKKFVKAKPLALNKFFESFVSESKLPREVEHPRLVDVMHPDFVGCDEHGLLIPDWGNERQWLCFRFRYRYIR